MLCDVAALERADEVVPRSEVGPIVGHAGPQGEEPEAAVLPEHVPYVRAEPEVEERLRVHLLYADRAILEGLRRRRVALLAELDRGVRLVAEPAVEPEEEGEDEAEQHGQDPGEDDKDVEDRDDARAREDEARRHERDERAE